MTDVNIVAAANRPLHQLAPFVRRESWSTSVMGIFHQPRRGRWSAMPRTACHVAVVVVAVKFKRRNRVVPIAEHQRWGREAWNASHHYRQDKKSHRKSKTKGSQKPELHA